MSFLKSVAVLVSGTALGHGITAAALPVLSRLYTPADFSLLAVFAGLVSIISVAACLRFDIAVSIPETDDEALTVVALAILSATILTLISVVIVTLAPELISRATNQDQLSNYLWLLPIGIFFAGTYSTLQSWFIRQKRFPLIARTRITQSASAAGTQLGLGAMGIAPFGLLFGNILNTGSACIGLGTKLLRSTENRAKLSNLKYPDLRQAFGKYDRFPKFSTSEALFNSAALQVPMIMIAAMAVGPEAGYLAFAMSVMQAPMALFGTAVGQVFISQAPHEDRNGNLAKFTTHIFEKLLKTGVGPLIAGGILAPVVFPTIFGKQWQPSGTLIAWMTPWFVMQFLSTPISMALHVAGRQGAAMALQGFGLALRVAAIWLAYTAGQSLGMAFSVANFLFYFIYLILILRVVGAKPLEIIDGIVRSTPIIGTITGIALLLGYFLEKVLP